MTSITGSLPTCFQARIGPTTWPDPGAPPSGSGFFYVVTAGNRLDEEGPKEHSSSGIEEPNQPVGAR